MERPETYRDALKGADTVVHLAASTGKLSAREHQRVNVIGTKALVDSCRENGVRRLMFLSTIAVKFPDKRGYPYAQSKSDAEEIVRRSGLEFVILRPTIVGGPGSPVFAGLTRLALLPVLPLFNGGRALVQPIHVQDLARFVLSVLDEDPFVGDTLEFGGPQVVAIKSLLEGLRIRIKGRIGRAISIPTAPLLPLLRMVESIVGPGPLPITSGQLSSFRFDGVINPNSYYERLKDSLRNISDMIAEVRPN